MRRVLLVVAVLFATLLNSATSGGTFSTNPSQLIYFYKPPSNGNLDPLVKYFKNFILSKGDESIRDTLKSKSVTAPFLLYIIMNKIQDPGSCTAQPNRNQVAWLPGDFCSISSQHPDWFLLDANGRRIVHSNSAGNYYQMDPGNSGWRNFFLTRAKQGIESSGWDGLFLDVVEASLAELRSWGTLPKKYPDDASYATAVTGMLNYLYYSYFLPQARPLQGNIGGFSDVNAWYDEVALMDGAMIEAFAAGWGTAYRTTTSWLRQLTMCETAQAQGKRLDLVTQGSQTDTARQQFGYASYLLVANGSASFRYSNSSSYRNVWVYANYDVKLGKPLGPRYQINGIWWRDFTYGKVSVDPVAHRGTITTTSPPPPTLYTYIYKEAESGTLVSPMRATSDVSASSSYYVWVPEGSGTSRGKVSYSFPIQTSGSYAIWGRVIGPNSKSNSFYVQVDNGTRSSWTTAVTSSWHWKQMGASVITLSQGTHSLTVYGKEDGTKLDRMLITNDLNYQP